MLTASNQLPHAAIRPTAITFDVDWAPDWTVELCANMCAAARVAATFFATHNSTVLSTLRRNPLFELGIHPNFLPGSSHGDSTRGVLDHCLEFVPEAISFRTHSLVQSTPLFECIADHYPQLGVDVSLLLYRCPQLSCFEMPFGASRRRLRRVPYGWEDDVAAIDVSWNWDHVPVPRPGVEVYAFHPIHVALNSNSIAPYRNLRVATQNRAYSGLDAATVATHAHSGHGTRTFLQSLLAQRGAREFLTIAAMAQRDIQAATISGI
jgi:hypothetical protein